MSSSRILSVSSIQYRIRADLQVQIHSTDEELLSYRFNCGGEVSWALDIWKIYERMEGKYNVGLLDGLNWLGIDIIDEASDLS